MAKPRKQLAHKPGAEGAPFRPDVIERVAVAAGPAVPEHHGGLLAFAAGNSHGQQHGQRENQGKQFLHVGFLLFYFISVLAR